MKFTPNITSKPVSIKRHKRQCSICSHAQRDDIERLFVSWVAPERIEKEHGVSRDAVYRHAHAFGLLEKRRQNVRAALERIIEKAGEVDVNAAAVVSAVAAYARINARGQWVERMEAINLTALFERMSVQELESYARDGTLPAWFEANVGATSQDGRGGSDEQ